MPTLHIRLFGKFSITSGEKRVEGLESCKAQELLSYLLLHPQRPHFRETLAGMLWGESTTAQSKKYLRQTLWSLQHALDSAADSCGAALLIADAEWVQVNPEADFWLDVSAFERLVARTRPREAAALDEAGARALGQAAELYEGDLLEGWYQDWCLCKREQLQNLLLSLLDRLMSYCEGSRRYEDGLAYGARILSIDRARERTHRRMMLLQYLAGDRTGALRQFDRCAAALKEELDVRPSRLTSALREQIRADQLEADIPAPAPAAEADPSPISLPGILNRLKVLQDMLSDLQRQILREMKGSGLNSKGEDESRSAPDAPPRSAFVSGAGLLRK